MNNLKVKTSTIIRIISLLVALINQLLAIFGKNVLPFTANTTYQVLSFIVTFISVLVNAWYNNDVTKCAILAGRVKDALKDGKISEDEVSKILSSTDEEMLSDEEKSTVNMINGILAKIKDKIKSIKKK